ncbi:DNA-binding transcriptional regulator [Alicyclobacillus fastidiosus]|uniref:DNA-binding transcriptional regulator n=1 Tax=Alicyclobacillus fastidiosus TaxID=392011 RepID=A0ABY6ZMM7_9BACL|nr:sugar-binding domain-containing protein [Alicyclobacillus fastidiosus]WAH43220.1 DNA-binding transcriptional regulator [Alicyclobacillus fastidiosus]
METSDWTAVRRVVPELMDVLQQRLRILQRVHLLGPIGRRALAQAMQQSERTLRAELDLLRQQGLLLSSAAGVSLSDEGSTLLGELEAVAAAAAGRFDLARTLSQMLHIQNVFVVEGDSDTEPWVADQLGLQAGQHLHTVLRDGDIVAVTGGTTVAALARNMIARQDYRNLQVVPARGGVGETVEYQANTIASTLAEKLGGTSIMLHVPDRLSPGAVEQLLTDPYVQERLPIIRSSTVVVHGIGDAMAMARRRRVSEEELSILIARGAKAEAFGYYFDEHGEVAYSMKTIGLRLSDIGHVREVVAVAGGAQKANAIAAAAKAYRIDTLVTDEGAARRLVQHQHNV